MESEPRVVHYRYDLKAALDWHSDRLRREQIHPSSVAPNEPSPFLRRCEAADSKADASSKPVARHRRR